MNIDTCKIRENATTITVIDTDANMKMNVSQENVRRILDKLPKAEPQEIAIVLATVEKSRIAANPEREITSVLGKYRGMRRIDDDNLCEGLTSLLREYDAEILSEIFENLKYFEISKILKSDAPNKEIRNYI